ncbi:pyruvate dehydrogenase E2 component (dihydrolipoamide acetyltransferase) [Sporothrix brasiliensis 5110]|uniref:Acetyltransferase component of pyruvate dehydrogenase complex n=1 Tax=Sporothrix brasiliensis 5110 TaxID=1398154 RepID=A0A0C2FNQ8_9PEZI|nr:pyruvate dehydrogenase E2 component (dihydrolipoamide acetyltransferase) [Sporothrix brasiliensis 5110]KIH92633.1 pyruvate dehydrogenase E2 component (dihydrolipoamide acetyltransferase) [Sporothrix brasiliensis 5110]
MLAPVLRRRVFQQRTVLRYAVPSALARFYASYPPHTVVKMPALSPTMTAGNIGAWQKKPGDAIAPGDVLVEIETDKAQMDFEYQEEGVLAKILKQTGDKDIAVGNPIAVLVEEGGDVSAFEGFTLADAGGDAAPAASESKDAAPAESAPTPAPTPSESAAPAEPEDNSSPGRLQTALEREPNIGAAAKRLAIEKGVKLDGLKGSGPGGKITESDVQKAVSSGSSAPSGSVAGAAGAAYEDIPLSGMRKTIANRLLESWNTNPHYFVSASLSVSKLQTLRQALNSTADGRYKLSVNDFLIKAIGVASRKVPQANSSWREGAIRQFNTVDVSVAVATPSGLITPIVKSVETKGLESISNAVKELAKRARDGKLKPEEYQGGSISISNMGMNPAVERFTAVVNPPQAAILAIGTTKKVAIPSENEDGSVGVEWDDQIVVTASFDHKVVDGAVGAEWIRELKQAVENPLELLL